VSPYSICEKYLLQVRDLGCDAKDIVVYEEISDSKAIVDRLIELRTARGLSQPKFAETVGCAFSLVSALERGDKKPSKNFLMKVAKAFNVTYSWLFNGVDSSEEQKEKEMSEIIDYLSDNALARERVLELIRNGKLEK